MTVELSSITLPGYVDLSSITLTGWNPRKFFDTEDLAELARSIKVYGVLEPLLVRPHESGYQLVAGERRYQAAALAGLTEVPVIIKDLPDRDVKEIMLVENLQRSQLLPLEEAYSVSVLLQEDITQEELASKIGKSQAWVANRLRLLVAPEELREMLIFRKITAKHVITLLPYVKYDKVFLDLLAALRITLEREDRISVKSLETLIDNNIGGYGNENVLRLDDIPWQYRDYCVDLSGCDGCKEVYESDRRYCLNTICWKDKINIAKNAFEKKQLEIADKLGVKGLVDTAKLDYDLYNTLDYEEFDKSGCESCDDLRLDQHRRQICMNPACFKKTKSSDTRAKNKVIRDAENSTWKMLDSWLEQNSTLGHDDIRRLLWFALYDGPSGLVQKAISPWGKFTSFYQDEIEDILKEIPEEQYLKALLRISVSRMLEFNGKLTCESFIQLVPPAGGKQ